MEIKAAIDALSPREYCELMALLNPLDDDAWDDQMKSDAKAGKLNALGKQVVADLGAGGCVPLSQVTEAKS